MKRLKRANNLFVPICDLQNIKLAWLKAIKGKRRAADVLLFSKSFTGNLDCVRNRLLSDNPQWGQYHQFIVKDPKERIINSASLPERIMHHAMMNILEPVFERHQIFHSYACRKGKGTHAAVMHAFKQTKKFRYFLKLDVRKYFDSIDQQVLLKQIMRLIKDEKVLYLLHGIIASYKIAAGKGLPIGNLTSQFFANHYLSGLDHFILEKLKPGGYARYMDDFVLWHSDKQKLKEFCAAVHLYCQNNLLLKLKTQAMASTVIGLPFLGFLIKPAGIFLLNKSKKRMKRRAKMIAAELADGTINEAMAALKANSVNASVLIARSLFFRAKLWKENSQGH